MVAPGSSVTATAFPLWALVLAWCGCVGYATYVPSANVTLVLVGCALLSAFLFRAVAAPLRLIDWAVMILLTHAGASFFSSTYPANGMAPARTVLSGCLIYLLVRMAATTRQHVAASLFVAASGVRFTWSAVSQFPEHFHELQANGFSDSVAFRSRLITPPSPWVPGEWFTLVLLTLPFAFALPASFWLGRRRTLAAIAALVPIPIAAALLLSCSRAVFWAVVVFVFVAFSAAAAYRILPARTALLGSVVTLCAFAVVLFTENAFYPGIAEAYLGRHASQVRSTEGRLTIWKRSADVFKLSPIWGVGSGNAPLYLAASADEEQTTGFASRTFSLPVQILVEKGIVGAVLHLAVLALAGWEAHRKLRSPQTSLQTKGMTCCLAAGLAAVLFRELTYSSLLEHAATAMLLAMILAFLATEEPV
jgi:hypothetical protein